MRRFSLPGEGESRSSMNRSGPRNLSIHQLHHGCRDPTHHEPDLVPRESHRWSDLDVSRICYKFAEKTDDRGIIFSFGSIGVLLEGANSVFGAVIAISFGIRTRLKANRLSMNSATTRAPSRRWCMVRCCLPQPSAIVRARGNTAKLVVCLYAYAAQESLRNANRGRCVKMPASQRFNPS